jgi:hypothetical protein
MTQEQKQLTESAEQNLDYIQEMMEESTKYFKAQPNETVWQ